MGREWAHTVRESNERGLKENKCYFTNRTCRPLSFSV
ncbi:hypothetical protein ISN45_At04g032980 [Arabidopsis thaliana x Arabidopsis arenosa]|uniref:Uncharacterized protein n=2 Tax=Arabidopsis TaxID=3701 RepID=A0A8T2EEL1_ARASU|nr:hypothetical protein ISN45_At04g032980 [Arabidopsis thaliana x Arabidopsis arenosa]KAG7622447.1 hypothetical protein ISN44_As04g032430 [Arabidopsis suecica]